MFEKPFRHNSSINESIEFVSLFFCLSLNINTTFKILRLLLYNGGGVGEENRRVWWLVLGRAQNEEGNKWEQKRKKIDKEF